MMQDVAYDLHSTFIIFYASLKHYLFTGLYPHSLTYFLFIEKGFCSNNVTNVIALSLK